MSYQGLIFRNEGSKTVEIDIEGYIGYSWNDSDQTVIKTKEKMKKELKKISQLKADIIIVNINSLGGCVNHGISIHDLLAEHSAKIITKINGMTASSATIIAMAGDERRMSDNSLILIHQAMTWSGGNKKELEQTIDNLKKIDNTIAKIYAKSTGKTEDEMLTEMGKFNGRGEWLSAEEAKKFNFITEIFEPMKATAYFGNDVLQKYGFPKLPENISQENQNHENIEAVIDKASNSFFTKVKDLFSNNNKTQKETIMTKFKNVNTILKVESLTFTNGKCEVTEEQIEAINNGLGLKVQAEADRDTAQNDYNDTIEAIDGIDPAVADAETVENKVKVILNKLAEKPGAKASGTKKDKDDPDGSEAIENADEINNEVENLVN